VDGRSLRNAAKKGATASRASDEPRLGLPRECRVVRRAEYDAVYREGRRRSSREFTLFVRPNGLNLSRFGWSIKKALGSAVQISPGWDIVIHPRSSAATADFSALSEELLKLMPRAPTPAP
jgi:RNase P protein component